MSLQKSEKKKSILKWAGGKSWMRERYAHMLPEPSTITRWNVVEVKVGRAINSKVTARGAVGEIIVTNYDVTESNTAGRQVAA